MYRIKTKDGRTILTEKPIYIRRHSAPGVYLMCKRERAEGVSYHGTPYFFDEGNSIQEVDGADELHNIRTETENMKTQLAQADDTAIELYEMQLTQAETNAAQDDALIELYEMIGG